MQLRNKRRGNVRATLAGLAAGLLAANGARAADDTGSRVDSGILFYQESGGRVQAIEPELSGKFDFGNQSFLSLGLVSDSLTGASPNGAVPSNKLQTFVTPARTQGSTSVTGASGGSTLVVVPSSTGTATTVRQYTVAPGKLPLDPGFSDQRYGLNLGWSQPIGGDRTASVGGSYSTEHDYQSLTGTVGIAQDFNDKNSTLNLAVNFESDSSQPIGGTPTPFTMMSGLLKGPNASRTETDVVLGLTQIMNRYWIVQVNYQYGYSQGYQNDPYRIISVVDPVSGVPLDNIYESRPGTRTRQSVYIENKIHLDDDIVDIGARYYRDSWGISSTTLEASDRSALGDRLYVEPSVRWYRQNAASFYRPFLLSNQALPQYASSDTRLGSFDGLTFGVKFGLAVGDTGEISLRGEYYRQSGNQHPSGVVGQLARQDLFPSLSAASIMLGYSFGL
jgi:hypothetical protein